MIEKLYKAVVHCFPPDKKGGRFRAGRFWASGENIVEGLTEKDLDALAKDVMLDTVNSLDRKTGKIVPEKVKRAFFKILEAEVCGEREVEDPKPAALPQDRIPTALEFMGVIRDLSQRLLELERRPPTQDPTLLERLRELGGRPAQDPALLDRIAELEREKAELQAKLEKKAKTESKPAPESKPTTEAKPETK